MEICPPDPAVLVPVHGVDHPVHLPCSQTTGQVTQHKPHLLGWDVTCGETARGVTTITTITTVTTIITFLVLVESSECIFKLCLGISFLLEFCQNAAEAIEADIAVTIIHIVDEVQHLCL